MIKNYGTIWYGQWAGNSKGRPEDTECCIEEVWPQDGSWVSRQCARKRGHGTDGLRCKQHARMLKEK